MCFSDSACSPLNPLQTAFFILLFFGIPVVASLAVAALLFLLGRAIGRLAGWHLGGWLVRAALAASSLAAVSTWGLLTIQIAQAYAGRESETVHEAVVPTLAMGVGALLLSAGIGMSAASAARQRRWRWVLLAQLALPTAVGLVAFFVSEFNTARQYLLLTGPITVIALIGVIYAFFLRPAERVSTEVNTADRATTGAETK